MIKVKRAGDTPIGINVLEGKSYYWCTCGLSAKQPFCDGSHKDTGKTPVKFVATESKDVFLCNCKKTNDKPFCDGSHSK